MKTKIIDEIIFRYRAGYPVIWVKTEEFTRCIELLRERFLEENFRNRRTAELKGYNDETLPDALRPKEIFYWDALNGLVNITSFESKCQRVFPKVVEGKPPVEPPAWAHILAWAGHLSFPTTPNHAVILVNGFHNLLAGVSQVEQGKVRAALLQIINPSLQKIEEQIRWGLREGDSFRTVIIVGPKPDHPVLSRDIMDYIEVMEFPRPHQEEIKQMIEIQLEGKTNEFGKRILDNEELVDQCAKELRGTTVFQSQNAIALTYVKKRDLDQETLRRQYKAIMELHPALTLAEYKETWEDLVGFELYKKFITALFHPNQKKTDHKGVLFVGAPGTGKSHAAKATGRYLNIKTIFCNFGRVFNKFVGDSEASTEAMFRSIDACGNVIVFIDEIEKALGGLGRGVGGDSGVGDRVLQQTLTWMNDHDSGAFIIATANDPEILPPELLREGRWDCIFSVPPPNEKQRQALLDLYAKKANLEHIDIKGLAQRTQNWVGAEIKGLMEKAEIFRMVCKNDEDAIETAMQYIRPMCVADKERFFFRVEKAKAQGVSVNIEEASKNFHLLEQEIPKRRRSFD